MTRFRITFRDDGVELRGYIDGTAEELNTFAADMHPGVVIASPVADDYNPWQISDPEHPPTFEQSLALMKGILSSDFSAEELLGHLAGLHYAQANVIRGERGMKEQAEQELLLRELHHFEAEHILDQIKGARSNHPECEVHPDDDSVTCGWKQVVLDIDKALAADPADTPWEYRPGSFMRDGRPFVQSGVIAPGYVKKYVEEGGEVLRRKVGPWEVFNG